MNENYEQIRIALAGATETGKTKFIEYLTNKNINFENYFPTIGVDFGNKLLLYKKNLYNIYIYGILVDKIDFKE